MKAYGYCRYSSDNQNEASIEQQKNELTEYAQRNNIDIIYFYCDEAKSGTKDNRENFQNMISDCRRKEVEAVLVWKTDRFARNTQDSLFYKMKLDKLGIKLISITQPIDTTTPEGALMYTMLAGMDEYYSKNLASNVKRALKNNAQNCLTNGGTAPLGYDIIDRKYVINKDEAPAIKKIFNWYINGMGLLEIASKLNSEGYKTKKGKTFGKNSIYEILGNEKYTGTYVYNKASGYNRHDYHDNVIKIENAFESIISKGEFEKVKEIREKNKKNINKFKEKHQYLLSGLLYCGKCGAKYSGSTNIKTKNGKKYEYGHYTCSNRNKLGKCTNHILTQSLIENEVCQDLINTILSGKTIESLSNQIKIEYKKLKESAKNDIKPLEKQLKEIRQNKQNIIDVIAKTGNADLVKQLENYSAQEQDLIEKLEFVKTNNDINISENKFEEILKKDISTLKNGSKEEIKKMLQKYIKRITVFDDKLDIEYTFTDKKISLKYLFQSNHSVSNTFTSTRRSSDFS